MCTASRRAFATFGLMVPPHLRVSEAEPKAVAVDRARRWCRRPRRSATMRSAVAAAYPHVTANSLARRVVFARSLQRPRTAARWRLEAHLWRQQYQRRGHVCGYKHKRQPGNDLYLFAKPSAGRSGNEGGSGDAEKQCTQPELPWMRFGLVGQCNQRTAQSNGQRSTVACVGTAGTMVYAKTPGQVRHPSEPRSHSA